MKRGLKDDRRQRNPAATSCVEESSPMKRGLKVDMDCA